MPGDSSRGPRIDAGDEATALIQSWNSLFDLTIFISFDAGVQVWTWTIEGTGAPAGDDGIESRRAAVF